MIYSGIIKGENNSPLKAQFAVLDVDGKIVGTVNTTDDTGIYSVDIPGSSYFLNVYAPGYVSTVYTIAELSAVSNNISLPKESNNALLIFGAVAAVGIGVAMMNKKKSNKISGGVTNQDLKMAAFVVGAIIAYNFLYKLCVKFGICTPADQLSTDSTSFWNPNFWQNVNPNGLPYKNPLTEDQARAYISQIKSAFGVINDSPEQVKGVFRSLYTQANASFIAWEYQKNEGGDLLAFLRNGGGVMWWDGLGDADIMEITNYVNSLPKF